MRCGSGLRDDQVGADWRTCCRGAYGSVGVTAADNRSVRGVPCSIGHAWGCRGGDLPERFGDGRSTRSSSRWAKSGVWERAFQHLAADADNEFAMIDRHSIVRAHQHSAGAQKKLDENQAIGRSHGGLSTKIHALVDALGNPHQWLLPDRRRGTTLPGWARTTCCPPWRLIR